MSDRIYLIECDAWNPSTETVDTHRFCTGSHYITKPTETPANAVYLPQVKQPFNFEHSVFSRKVVGGASEVGYGTIVLVNNNGSLDGLFDCVDGRSVRVLVGCQHAAYAEFDVLFTGTMERAETDWDTVKILIRDWLADLDGPLQTTLYAGDNVLPSGAEGTEEDLKDQPKPLVFGTVYNITPPCVNTSKAIYQVHDGPVQAISAVYENGLGFTAGSDHSDLAALEAASTSAGTYDTCLALGLFRLGSDPVGAITADVDGDTTGGTYVSTVAEIIERILTTRCGWSISDLDTASFSALNSACSYSVGIFSDGDQSAVDVFDELCNSIGAWYTITKDGLFRVGRLVAPDGAPETIYTSPYLLTGGRGIQRISAGNLPAYRVKVNHTKNWTTQTDVPVGDTESRRARRAWLSEEYRSVTDEDTNIQTAHPHADELEFDTLLTTATDAGAEASRLLDLYKEDREQYIIKVQAEYAQGVDLGDVVELRIDRFGLSSGKLFVVLGLRENYERNTVEMTLYG